jgi:hypothetical protein
MPVARLGGGAKARKTETSPEFIVSAISAII